jgi:sugar/nucleoside kinase (ribokinase family)
VNVIDVVVAGHLCLDMLPEMGHVPLSALGMPGRLSETGRLVLSTGGAVSNTGVALHRLGVNVRLMANVGDDFVGQAIVNILEGHDPSLCEYIRVLPGEPGSYTIVLSPERVDRIFLSGTGPNSTFGTKDVDFSVLKNTKLFHLGYPPLLPRLFANGGEELIEIFRRAKDAGVVTSLDMTLPDPNSPSGQVNWPKVFQRTLPHLDIFIPSIEEALFCLRRADYDAWNGAVLPHLTATYLSNLADELIGMGGVIVGFKLGEMGMYLKTGDAARFERLVRLTLDISAWANVILWSPAFQVDVMGTTGAGDSAYAGFLTSLLHGLNPEETLRFACAAGACNVEAADSTSGVRTWDTIQARLDAGWSYRPEQLPGPERH